MKVPVLLDQLVENPKDPTLQRQLQAWLPQASTAEQAMYRTYQEFENLDPTTFVIETVMACNLHCPECAIGGGITTRKKKILSYEDYLVMADRIKEHCKYLYLHLWGEPFMNKDILPMVRHASRFTKVNLSTNALLIKDQIIPEIFESGLADLIVSIDGMSQESYEKYRVGGKVDLALAILAKLAEANRRAGHPVRIMPQFIAFAHNEHEMEQFRSMCQGIGLEPCFKAPYIRSDDSKFSPSSQPHLQRPLYRDEASLLDAISGCASPRDAFTIDVEGNAILCCHDYDSSLKFGNLFQSDFDSIWSSPFYRKTRWEIMTRRPPQFCVTSCMTYSMEKPAKAATTGFAERASTKLNLCGGGVKVEGYINLDLSPFADIQIDLEKELLPFPDATVDVVVCMSAINYFTRDRALEIIQDVRRVLRPEGIARFGTQDLRVLAKSYLDRDEGFLLQKLPNGTDRFPGPTLADKFCNWFYGFVAHGKPCRYVYDFDSLALLFQQAGFEVVSEKRFGESDLAEVDALDNRPEQMFFLEAIKTTARTGSEHEPALRSAKDEAVEFWQNGRREEAWQRVLEVLRDPECEWESASWALDLARQVSTPEELGRLLKELDERFPGTSFPAARRETEALIQARAVRVIRDRAMLGTVLLPSSVRPDSLACLHRALDWLVLSESVTGGNGSSAYYDFEHGTWGSAYPETTGYIIPTMLRAANVLERPDLHEIALRMGDWLLRIQERSGALGEALGSFAKNPRVFNTGQALLGLVSLARVTKESRFLKGARGIGDWLCTVQDADGKWSKSTYAGPRPYHVRVAWALMELHATSGNQRYLDASEAHLEWLLAQSLPNGCFRGNSLDKPDQPWTHLIGYVLYGLLELLQARRKAGLPESDQANSLLREAARHLKRVSLMAASSGLPSFHATYDLDWNPTERWSCLTGNAQLSHFLTNCGWWFGDVDLRRFGRDVLGPTMAVQFGRAGLEPDMIGGLPGAFPSVGGYLIYQIPNWGVKFFADAIMEIEHPNRNRVLLLG